MLVVFQIRLNIRLFFDCLQYYLDKNQSPPLAKGE